MNLNKTKRFKKKQENIFKSLKKYFQNYQEHNKLDEINNKRPPFLWNHPDIKSEPH